jgi:hypothetical protein
MGQRPSTIFFITSGRPCSLQPGKVNAAQEMGKKTTIFIFIWIVGFFASSLYSHSKSAGSSIFPTAVHEKQNPAKLNKSVLVYPSILVF